METNLPKSMRVGDYVYTPTGWKCPTCGNINAPSVLQCPCSLHTPSPVKPYMEPFGPVLCHSIPTGSPLQMLNESNNGKL